MEFLLFGVLAIILIILILFAIIFFLLLIAEKNRQQTGRHPFFQTKRERYYKTEYAIQTQNSYEQVMSDEGLLGEFFIYKALESLEAPRKFLFNLYLPKWNGGTTELDMVLLHESGIYVFESKNYGGWIFGSETQQHWTQTLPAGRGQSQKYRFYNPILQNSGHLDRLYQVLRPVRLLSGPPPYYSYIVFSDRCEFMDVPQKSGNHHVLHLGELFFAVRQNISEAGVRLTAAEIEILYQRLEPHTHVSDAVKQAHIENIRLKYH